MTSLTVGSLFSGIGGFDLGLERAGHRVLWQVEKDEKCRSVLRRHWPDVDLHEDVCDVGRSNLAPVDLICGGFPCQDLSVAGRRAGLDGARSGLWFEFHRIVFGLAPTWVLIENVPGLLSSNGGRDLAVIVRGLEEFGYGWAYRILDSQYFGVAQRRRRVYVLACRDPRAGCPAEVLALAEGMSGHPAPSREAGAGVAATVAASPPSQRNGGSDPVAGHFVTAHPLRAQSQSSHRADSDTYVAHALAGPLRAATPGMGGVQADDEHVVAHTLSAHSGLHDEKGQTFVAHTLRAEGHDASEDGTGRGVLLTVAFQPKASAHQSMNPGPLAPALGTTKELAIYQCHGSNVGEMGHLRSGNGHVTGGVPFVVQPLDPGGVLGTQDTVPTGDACDADAQEAGPGEVLRALREEVGEEAAAVWEAGVLASLWAPEVLQPKVHGARVRGPENGEDERCELVGGARQGSSDLPTGPMRTVWEAGCSRRTPPEWRLAGRLAEELGARLSLLPHPRAPGAANVFRQWMRATPQGARLLRQALPAIQEMGRPARSEGEPTHATIPRRLTPRECARLQAFPDDWLDGLSDSAKYRALGNAVTVNVAHWLGHQLYALGSPSMEAL